MANNVHPTFQPIIDAIAPKAIEHTQTPWAVTTDTNDEDIIPGTTYYAAVVTLANDMEGQEHLLYRDGESKVAMMPPTKSTQGHEINKANAAFIVRACNSHEQLVEALRIAEKFIGSLDANDSAVAVPYQAVKNALALAESK